MTVQDILNELDLNISAAGIESAVKENMPGYEVEAFDDDTQLGDSYNTASVLITFIQNQAENKVLEDIDLGSVLTEDEYGGHSYTVVAIKIKEN